jgi:hypothetical protein
VGKLFEYERRDGEFVKSEAGKLLRHPLSGAAWAALRDELQRMYGEIGETVLEAGEAIRQARQAYIDADMVCADTLSQYLADPANHDPNNPASNPPVKGADDNPGEPVMP